MKFPLAGKVDMCIVITSSFALSFSWNGSFKCLIYLQHTSSRSRYFSGRFHACLNEIVCIFDRDTLGLTCREVFHSQRFSYDLHLSFSWAFFVNRYLVVHQNTLVNWTESLNDSSKTRGRFTMQSFDFGFSDCSKGIAAQSQNNTQRWIDRSLFVIFSSRNFPW